MAELSIHRTHALGLTAARAVCAQWVAQSRERYGLRCEVVPGEQQDTVRFSAPGVTGELRVSGEAFTLQAQLSFLLSAFSRRIEDEIQRNLDALLGPDTSSA